MASPSIDRIPLNRTVNQFAGAETLFPGPQDSTREAAPADDLPDHDPRGDGAHQAATASNAAPASSGWEYGPGIVGTRPTSALPDDGPADDSDSDSEIRNSGPIDHDPVGGGDDGGDGDGDGGGAVDGDGNGGDGGDGSQDGNGNLIDNLVSGLTGDGGGLPIVGNAGSAVTGTVGQATGSGGSLNLPDLGGLLGGDGGGLVDGVGLTGVTGLVQDTVSSIGGIGGNNGIPDVGNVLTSVVDPLLGGDGNVSLDGLLDAVGDTAGGLVDGVLEAVTGDGSPLGGVLDTLGGDILGGTVGGSGLLAGTPLEGLTGDGAAVSTGVMHGDDPGASGLLQLVAGNDPSSGLLNIDAASEDGVSESGQIVALQAGPQTSGSGLEADLLGAERDSSGSLADVGIGQHDGPSVVDINALTAADSFEFPALNGTGLDSLVGAIGVPVPGGGDGVLPVSIGLDGDAVIDIGADGLIDLASQQQIESGTDVMLNTPFHA